VSLNLGAFGPSNSPVKTESRDRSKGRQKRRHKEGLKVILTEGKLRSLITLS
jgi:hypothetical protein